MPRGESRLPGAPRESTGEPEVKLSVFPPAKENEKNKHWTMYGSVENEYKLNASARGQRGTLAHTRGGKKTSSRHNLNRTFPRV